MDLSRAVYNRDLKIAAMRALDAGAATGEIARKYQLSPNLLTRWRNVDFSLLKDTKLTDRFSQQFRAEFFNLANHAQFTKVDGNISSGDVAQGGTFGKVLRARDPRLIQFAMKLIW